MPENMPAGQDRLREQLEAAREDVRRRRSEVAADAGRVLRAWRTASGIHQDSLAALGCVTDTVVRRVEKGDYGPAPESLIEAVRSLGGPSLELHESVKLMRQLQAQQKQVDKLLLRKTLTAGVAALAQGDVAIAGRVRPAVMPRPPAHFVGRQQEVNTLEGLLGHERLITVTGPGGIGKTALCLHFVGAQPTVPTGPWFADLSEVSPGEPVLPVVARLVLDEDEGRRELRDDDEAAKLLGAVSDLSALIVLDNCEHVLAGASAAVSRLLDVCPGLRILATSREPLHLPDESIMTLGPLPVSGGHRPGPGATVSGTGDAVELFTRLLGKARGGAHRLSERDAATVADLCRQLDGIPLCIELAAARARTLPLTDIADSVSRSLSVLSGGRRDLPRHQTIDATIRWSWDLLAPGQQRALSRLSILAVPFSFGCATRIAAGEVTDGEQLVADLADKSLVLPESANGDSKLRVLGVVRSFAAAHLNEDDRRDAVHALMTWAISTTDIEETALQRPDILRRLDADFPVLKAALELSEDAPADQVRLALAIWRYWDIRSLLAYGSQFLAKAHDDGVPLSAFERGRALGALARLQNSALNFPASIETSKRSVEIRRAAGDPVQLRWGLMSLLMTLIQTGRFAEAEEYLAEINEIPGEPDAFTVADLNGARAILCMERRDPASAIRLLREAQQIYAAHDAQAGVAVVLHNLSLAHRVANDPDASLDAALEAGNVGERVFGSTPPPEILVNAAAAQLALGKHQEALTALDAMVLGEEASGDIHAQALALRAMAASAMAPAAAAALLLEHVGDFTSHSIYANHWMQFVSAAQEIAFQGGAYEHAARLIGLHDSIWRLGGPIEVGPPAVNSLGLLEKHLSQPALETLITEGRAIDTDRALDFTTGILSELAASAQM